MEGPLPSGCSKRCAGGREEAAAALGATGKLHVPGGGGCFVCVAVKRNIYTAAAHAMAQSPCELGAASSTLQ